MKTLDEVIKAMENCYGPDAECCDRCRYTKEVSGGGSVCLKYKLEDDALHYLKELRFILDNTVLVGSTKEEKGFWKLPTLPETGNDPLTLDKLKTMEGKPVWIELLGNGHWKGWDVVGGFTDDDFGHVMVTVRGDDYYFADYGRSWQAYRKERKFE